MSAFSLEAVTAFAAGDVDFSFTLGYAQIGFAAGANEELVVLALAVHFSSDADTLNDGCHVLHIMQVFQIALFDVAAECAVENPHKQENGCTVAQSCQRRKIG